MMTWKAIAMTLGFAEESEKEVKQLLTDSRLLDEPSSTVFFAHRGLNHDGHDFIVNLIDLGVEFFVVEDESFIKRFPDLSIILVKDSITALQKIATAHRSKFEYPVVSIAGSNGKTTVKEWLAYVLATEFNLVKSPKSFNSQIGVPLSVWQMSAEHQLAIFETGVSKKGEMKKLRPIIRPTLGIFTCIGPAHEEGFDSLTEKIDEKASLFDDAAAVICRKDNFPVYQGLKNRKIPNIITWSTKDSDATYFFEKQEDETFILSANKVKFSFSLPFKLDIWIENALHVVVAALELGCPLDEVRQRLMALKPVKMRLEVKPGVNQCYLIDDTYNNDLQGLGAALNFLKLQQQRKKRTVVLSDFLQTRVPKAELYGTVADWFKKEKIDRLIAFGADLKQHQDLFECEVQTFEDVDGFLAHPPAFRDETILVKGARNFELEKIVQWLEDQNHRTILEINFESIIHNLTEYRKLIKPDVKVMIMVKAFAYGGGSLEIANLLQFHKVDYLGVAYNDEAVKLRENGIKLPIMVMNPDFSRPDLFLRYDLEPEIYHFEGLRSISSLEKPVYIHIKLETGMNRLGFTESQLTGLVDFLKLNRHIRVRAIFSHLAAADDPEENEFTRGQAEKFQRMYDHIAELLEIKPERHLLNSAGIARWPKYQFELVRLGIGLYGFDPSGQNLNLRPISTLRTRVSQVKKVKQGETIGYGRMGKARQDLKIAIVPIGYADGYQRLFSQGNGKMMIDGQLVPTIGNVCMDMTMLDVTGLDVTAGEEVIVFGASPTIQELARWSSTIPYEILTNISQRVKRIYLSE